MSTNLACSKKAPWSREEDKAFENALAVYGNPDNRWEKIAANVPSRTIAEIKEHYWTLCDDVEDIHAGRVPLPPYVESSINSESCDAPHGSNKDQSEKKPSQSGHKEGGSARQYGRKKGKPWSSMEHGLFLQGLKKYGRGDWRSISRKCVLTKTSTQVASHAQKYFKRLDEVTAARKRTSIHDMAILDDGKLVTKRMITKGEDEESVRESMMNIGNFPTLDSSSIVVSDNYFNSNNNVGVPSSSYLPPSLNATADSAQDSLFKIPGTDFSSYPCTNQPDLSIPSWTEQMIGIQNHGLVSGSSGSQQVMFDPYGSIPQNMIGFTGFMDDPMDNTHGISGFMDDLMMDNQLGISGLMDDPMDIQQIEAPLVNGHQRMSTFLAETVEEQTLEEHLTGTIQDKVLIDKGKSPVETMENEWENYVYDFKDFASASSSGFNIYDNNTTASHSSLLPDVSTKVDGLGTDIPMMDYSEYPSYDSFSPNLRDLEELEFPPSP